MDPVPVVTSVEPCTPRQGCGVGGSEGRRARLFLLGAALWAAILFWIRHQLDSGNLQGLAAAGRCLWRETFWLPNNLTWAQQSAGTLPLQASYHPRPLDALLSLSVALTLLALRLLYAEHVARPLGRHFGIRHQAPRPPRDNHLLDIFFNTRGPRPDPRSLADLSKKLEWPERQVSEWFRRRRNCSRPSAMDKWCEGTFKLIYYFTVFWSALYILWQKSWFHDHTQYHTAINLVNHMHPMEWDIFIYYQVSLGFYWSLFISQFSDRRRKDFWEMFAHHTVTIVMMTCSFATGWHRIGCLILITHDFSDWTLELTKNAQYAGYERLAKASLVLLLVGWVGSRLVYYPIYVLSIVVVEQRHLYTHLLGYYYFSTLLLSALLPLHVIWLYYLSRTIYFMLTSGEAPRDARSSSDEDSVPGNSRDNPAQALVRTETRLANGHITSSQMQPPPAVVHLGHGDASSPSAYHIQNGGHALLNGEPGRREQCTE